jgi:hypothetical protein
MRFRLLSLFALGALAVSASAQIPGLDKVKIPGIPGLDAIFKKGPAITTNLKDCKWEDKDKDGFTPREAERSLMTLQRTPNGGFVLQPGYYSMQVQSYCLKAGTHGPGSGDGYLFAPPKGPAENVVMKIVRGSVNRPEIPQQDIQVLLWAIIARTKLSDMPQKMQQTAATFLTPNEIFELNGGALGLLSDDKIGGAFIKQPPLLRQVYEAEAKLRNLMTNPASSFADMERVAVLAGVAPLGEGSREVPGGRWSLHPDGYYVRYLPSGYSSTRVEIWVPQGSPAVGKEFDPATHIAVPGNTARQRLIQSGRAQPH